jgi:uncharacterized protein (DUF2062 family)
MIMIDRLKRWARFLYLKLFRINDTPLKIALGFGLGAFVGVMPGVGPVIALFFAFLFRVNRLSALLGSVLFNTWLSFIALLLAIKVGALVMGRNYEEIRSAWAGIFKDFKWEKLWDLSVNEVLLPIGVGYLIISLLFAVAVTAVVYVISVRIKTKRISNGACRKR